MNLFEFDSSAIRISGMFWLYWSILIPLTLMTLVPWAIWVNRTKLLSWRHGSNEDDDSHVVVEEKPNEGITAAQDLSTWRPDLDVASIYSGRSARASIAGSARLSQRSLAARSSRHSSLLRSSTLPSRLPRTAPPPQPPNEPFSVTVHDDPLPVPKHSRTA